MAVGTVAPVPRQQFFTNAGAPLAGGKIWTYAAGTTTALAAYTDSTLATAHANPIVLDAAGRATIYLALASYKFVVTDANDVAVWTQDAVGANTPYAVDTDLQGVAGASITAGQAVYLADGTGGTTAGRWYPTDADAGASSARASMVGMALASLITGATGTLRVGGRMTGLSGLTPGAVYYCSGTLGALTATPPDFARAVGTADTTTSLVLHGNALVGDLVRVASDGAYTTLNTSGILAWHDASGDPLGSLGSTGLVVTPATLAATFAATSGFVFNAGAHRAGVYGSDAGAQMSVLVEDTASTSFRLAELFARNTAMTAQVRCYVGALTTPAVTSSVGTAMGTVLTAAAFQIVAGTLTTVRVEATAVGVGIGTSASSAQDAYALVVRATDNAYAACLQGSVTTNHGYGLLCDAGTGAGDWCARFRSRVTGGGGGDTIDSFDLFTIRGDGRVGIGTVAPTSILHIVGLPSYANNETALAGGLTAGACYLETSTNPRRLCVTYAA